MGESRWEIVLEILRSSTSSHVEIGRSWYDGCGVAFAVDGLRTLVSSSL